MSDTIIARFHSRSSLASSKRFESAASDLSGECGFGFEDLAGGGDETGGGFLEEGVDEDTGERRWFHVEWPQPQPLNVDVDRDVDGDGNVDLNVRNDGIPGAGPDLDDAARARPGFGHRLSWLRAQRGEGRGGVMVGGEEKGMVVVGRARGMRPVSVEGGLGRGRPGSASLRGDLAFV